MNDPQRPPLSGEQKVWAFAAAGWLLIAIGFLGFALSTGVMVVFAAGWVVLQLFGYAGALKMARGDFGHPLFRSQVMLHIMALALLAAVFVRALG